MKETLVAEAQKYIYQLDCFSEEAVKKQIHEELNEILALNAEEVLGKRQAYIGIGDKEDYLNRWIKTCEGYVLAGIRHMGGNPNEPFVFMWPSFKMEDINKVIVDLKPHFVKFSPKSYNFWIRPDCNDYEVKILQQRFIGRLDEMSKDNLELSRPLVYYEWYKEQYRLFHKVRPDFIDRVPVNPKEMMDECLEEGLLFLLKDETTIIGLIAGERQTFLGEPTIYIDEILISSEYRGKGYAKRLLGSFINRLDAKYLTCHIDHENISSTKTAIRGGEKVFSQECSIHVEVNE